MGVSVIPYRYPLVLSDNIWYNTPYKNERKNRMARKRAVNTATIDSLGSLIENYSKNYEQLVTLANNMKSIMGGISLDANSIAHDGSNTKLVNSVMDKVELGADKDDSKFINDLYDAVDGESKDAILLFAKVYNELRDDIDAFETTMDKLNERIVLTDDKSSPEVKVAQKKLIAVTNNRDLREHRIKVDLVAFFKLRHGMIRAINNATKVLCERMVKGSEVTDTLSKKLSIIPMMEEMIKLESTFITK